MIGRRLAWIVIPAALATAGAALAEGPAQPPAASSEQVQQLQAQLEQMSKELADMKKLVESGEMPAQQRQMMMSHMGRMEGPMQGMMSSCCMMDPASCPHMGASPAPR